ncbi:MAG TPA: hypothetical protein VN914_10000, partial [Polyangia bacterium]|nr:hypothetical protein [Polyangia bacterium]
TGCCQLFTGQSTGFCADAKFCVCGGGAGGKGCAPGTTCGSAAGDPAISCRPDCKTAADCATACCTQPLPGKDHGICVEKSNCP